MSEALIRHCPKCKLQVIKDNGCNKLTCVNCKTSMCYICQRDITGASYKHFSGAPGSCSIGHDPREDDAQRDVNRARAEATQKILAENPNINPEDLRVDVPDYNSSPPRRLHGYPARPQVYLPPARNRRAPRTLGKYNNNRRGNGNGNGNGPVYEMGDFVLDENNAQDPWQLPLHDQDEHRVFMNAWENMYHQQNLQAHPNLLGGYPNTPAQPNPGIPHFSARPDFGFGKPNPRNAYALATPPGPPAPAPAPNFNNARLVPPFGQGFGSNNTTINYPLQPAERDPFAPAPAPPWVNNTGFDGWLQRHSGR